MEEKKKKSKLKIIIPIIVLVIIIISVIVIVKQNEEKEHIRIRKERIRTEQLEEEYKEKIAIVCDYMSLNTYKGSTLTSEYLKLVKKYGNYLSDEIIANTFLYSSDSLSEQINIAKKDNEKVVETMSWLTNNKIDKYTDVYNVVLEMYDAYIPFFDSTIKLNFGLYSIEDTMEKGKIILEKYNKIKTLMPEIKDIIKNLDEEDKEDKS